jgi:hypothetical protein
MLKMVGICQVMWLVMLESAMDRILEVDTPGQLMISGTMGTTYHGLRGKEQGANHESAHSA